MRDRHLILLKASTHSLHAAAQYHWLYLWQHVILIFLALHQVGSRRQPNEERQIPRQPAAELQVGLSGLRNATVFTLFEVEKPPKEASKRPKASTPPATAA